jgi:DNA-binding MarR family transcriptional regulator
VTTSESRRDVESKLSRDRVELTQNVVLVTQLFGTEHGIGASELAAYLYLVVAAASGKPIRPTDLLEPLQLSRPAVTYVIERLVSRGYVARVSDPADRRTYTVEVTKVGREAVAESTRRVEATIHEALSSLPDNDIHAAERVIRAMTTAARSYKSELAAAGVEN